jgi:hypothetical protein
MPKEVISDGGNTRLVRSGGISWQEYRCGECFRWFPGKRKLEWHIAAMRHYPQIVLMGEMEQQFTFDLPDVLKQEEH